jgi:hypothetical protein
MELYCTREVNTLQLNTDSNSSNTRTRPTCMVPEHSFLQDSSNRTSCGNLPTLTSILTVRRLLNTRRDNPSSGYRSTCTPQRHLGVYIINLPFTSPDTQARLSSNDSQTTLTSSFQVPFISPRHIHSNARFNCCVTRETQQTHCYSTGTVALLRKHNKPIVTQQSAEVMLPRKPNM